MLTRWQTKRNSIESEKIYKLDVQMLIISCLLREVLDSVTYILFN